MAIVDYSTLELEIPIFLTGNNEHLLMRKTGWSNGKWVQILTLPLIVHVTEGNSLAFMNQKFSVCEMKV